jgi:hypothetical protein
MTGKYSLCDTVRIILDVSLGTKFLNQENTVHVLKGIFEIYND